MPSERAFRRDLGRTFLIAIGGVLVAFLIIIATAPRAHADCATVGYFIAVEDAKSPIEETFVIPPGDKMNEARRYISEYPPPTPMDDVDSGVLLMRKDGVGIIGLIKNGCVISHAPLPPPLAKAAQLYLGGLHA